MWTRGPAFSRGLSSYLVDLNGISNAGSTSVVGYKLTGLNAGSTYLITQPSGRLYSGWSGWSIDASGPPAGAWLNELRATATAGPTWTFGGAAATYANAEAARIAFIPGVITGYSEYTFWISEGVTADNRGGLSLTVDEI